MKKKDIAAIASALLMFILVVMIAYLVWSNKERPVLTESVAIELVRSSWGDCLPENCSDLKVSIERQDDITLVIAIYDGLMDDSIKAEKKTSIATYTNGTWILGSPTTTYKCQLGRGHQDFSAELCL